MKQSLVLKNELNFDISNINDSYGYTQLAIRNYLLSLDSQHSVRTQLSKLKSIASCFDTDLNVLDFSMLTKSHVLTAVKIMLTDKKPNTVNAAISALKQSIQQFLEFSIDSDTSRRMESILKIKRVKVYKEDVGRSLSREEIEGIFFTDNFDSSSPRGLRNKLIFSTLFFTGLRRSEVVSLNRNDVNLNESFLTVKGKGGKTRKVFFNRQLSELFQEYFDTAYPFTLDENPPIFTRIFKDDTLTNKRLSSQTVYDVVKSIEFDENCTVHDFRRTYITNLFQNDIDVSTIQKLVGHSSPATTVLYDRRGDESLKVAAQTINL